MNTLPAHSSRQSADHQQVPVHHLTPSPESTKAFVAEVTRGPVDQGRLQLLAQKVDAAYAGTAFFNELNGPRGYGAPASALAQAHRGAIAEFGGPKVALSLAHPPRPGLSSGISIQMPEGYSPLKIIRTQANEGLSMN
jgi:hypothetical protein